jgi:transposase-like protein
MNAKTVTAEYRQSQWLQVIKKRNESGMTVKDFCQAEGITKDSYYYWLRKLREKASLDLSVKTETKPIPVQPLQPPYGF